MKDRIIKFKIWNKVTSKMYHRVLIGKVDPNCENYTAHQIYIDDKGWVNADELDSIPLQYINKKDKNGVEIFEGDLVSGVSFNGTYCYGSIVFHGNTYHAIPILKFADGVSEDFSNMEVIGNIYENRELLK